MQRLAPSELYLLKTLSPLGTGVVQGTNTKSGVTSRIYAVVAISFGKREDDMRSHVRVAIAR